MVILQPPRPPFNQGTNDETRVVPFRVSGSAKQTESAADEDFDRYVEALDLDLDLSCLRRAAAATRWFARASLRFPGWRGSAAGGVGLQQRQEGRGSRLGGASR